MSYNQSRSDKSDSTQYRKSERRSTGSNQQRGSSGAYGKGGGPALSPSNAYPGGNRSSYKKNNTNAQGGGQSRSAVPNVNTSSVESNNGPTPRSAALQNGSHVQPQLHGPSDMAAAKPAESSVPHRSNRTVPKAPTSQASSVSSEMAAPRTPTKAPGDASNAFSFQFGSLSPGIMNGMQVPARTSSAPPNLDEQKRDQARHDSYRSAPSMPTPAAPKQQLPRKDMSAVNQSNTGEAQLVPKAKRDAPAPPTHTVGQQQKPPGVPMSGMSMSMPFIQPQVPVPFGGSNQQLQSQGMTAAASLQMQLPVPLGMGNPQVQFVHPHMQAPGIIHQGQGLGFPSQMGPQLPPQMANMGITMSQQYQQQQGGKFGGVPKTPVKITHPDTREELRLDKRTDSYTDSGSSGPWSHHYVPPQSQPIPSYAPSHPISFYPPNSFNPSSMYYQPQSSVSLTSSQMAPNPQAPRFNYGGQGPPNMAFMGPAHNSLPVNKTGNQLRGVADLPNVEHSREVHSILSSAPSTVHVTVKPSATSVGEKIAESVRPNSSHGFEKGESPKPVRASGEAGSSHLQKESEIFPESSLLPSKPTSDSVASKLLPVETDQLTAVGSSDGLVTNPLSSPLVSSEESVVVVHNGEGRKRENLGRSNSIKEHQKKPGKKGNLQSQHQVGSQSTSTSNMHYQAVEHGTSSERGVSGVEEAKPVLDTPTVGEDVSSSLQSQSTVGAAADTSELKVGSVREGIATFSSEISAPGIIVDNSESVCRAKLDESSFQDKELLHETVGKDEQGEGGLPEGFKQDISNNDISSELISAKSSECVEHTEDKQSGQDSQLKEITCEGVLTSETEERGVDELAGCCAATDETTGLPDGESCNGEKTSAADAASGSDSIHCTEVVTISSISDQQSSTILTPDLLEATLKPEGEGAEENIGSSVVSLASASKDKPSLDPSKAKSTAKGKKKRKEILQKADAAGTTSDLYNAYKGPEEKKETVMSVLSTESTSDDVSVKHPHADAVEVDAIPGDKGGMSKTEPDDWEDAADISTPKLEVSDRGHQVHGKLDNHEKEEVITGKKYSRDFLLKFAEQYNELPQGFEITSDAEALMNTNFSISQHVERDSYPSPGRIIDRPSGGSRIDRRGSGVVEEDRWSKLPGNFSGTRLDLGHGGSVAGFRPAPGGNYGVLRNPRGQPPMQYSGGILLGPSVGSQGGMARNSPDSERWLRATNIQKGLIPSPNTPLQTMHRAKNKYEVGKVTDEEQAKQRQLKAILNKLTPQNFDKLFEQVKAVNIDNAGTLNGVISQIFDKALMEPTFCEMYADFCCHLAVELPGFDEDNEKITFKRVLLNKCQEEFERGEREQEEADKADEEGEIKQTAEEREEKRIKARRRMLGNIRLIGELYKKRMLTERIMHACIQKLLGTHKDPDEEDLEALCKLMSTIGEMIDHPKAKEHIDAYFDRMKIFSNNMNFSSRVRFMLKDAIDLRKNKWQQRRKVEGPKKIEEVHRDAAQERQAQASRLARAPSINQSSRRAPMDFGSRGSTMLSSPNAQSGGYRGMPAQVRGYGHQDVRMEERPSYEARTSSMALPQRPVGDDSITLGPQGGLGRGMSIRGPTAMSSVPAPDVPSVAADSRRMAHGLNGYGAVSDRTTTSVMGDVMPRHTTDRTASSAAYDELGSQERNVNLGNRDLRNSDRSFERSLATSSRTQGQGTVVSHNAPMEKVLHEDKLQDMSLAAIKEFYSARDEKEVELCIKDLHSPGFHPSMVSLWVTDSFERKDMERDLLAKLLVNLAKSQDGVLTQSQLSKGFESVLATLEDAVNDAPRAAEFLGRIFAKVITENVIPLGEIGMLIRNGGEEPGHLVEIGLAAEVLGCTLENVRSDKGDEVLSDMRRGSKLHLEDFRPQDPNRSRKLEKFI